MTTVTAEATNGLEVQLEIPEVARVCPAGMNPPKKKEVSKLYFITTAAQSREDSLAILNSVGFRTKDEAIRHLKACDIGRYRLITMSTKDIVIEDVRRVKGV